jgi:hypothetical protein
MPNSLPPNPFRPGAGQPPPYLAGRRGQSQEFRRLLKQDVILENMVLAGLRGVGKTVLLDTIFRSEAIQAGWGWVGNDMSESSSASEEQLALRLITDLAVYTSSLVIGAREFAGVGFRPEKQRIQHTLDFRRMWALYQDTPGLVSDKLKRVLECAWECMQHHKRRGLVFAYDEAQNLSDHPVRNEYPLSLLLDVFQSLQKKEIPFLLVLAGLPPLFPKLVAARTFAERMFRVVFLDRLNENDSRDAILEPIRRVPVPLPEEALKEWGRKPKGDNSPTPPFPESWIDLWTQELAPAIVGKSGGYPYFIQFLCREYHDLFVSLFGAPYVGEFPDSPDDLDVVRKLDSDFYAGRWDKTTDRQRELLTVIAHLDSADEEFTVREIVEKSKEISAKPFRNSHVSQMLVTLSDAGLVYRNRHGKYSFAVPLLGRFILRQQQG